VEILFIGCLFSLLLELVWELLAHDEVNYELVSQVELCGSYYLFLERFMGCLVSRVTFFLLIMSILFIAHALIYILQAFMCCALVGSGYEMLIRLSGHVYFLNTEDIFMVSQSTP